MKKYFRYFITAILIIFIACLCFFRFSGKYEIRSFCSESMHPTLKEGDLIVTRLISRPEKIEIGDIVYYKLNSYYEVLHRVLWVSDQYIIAKGDANNDSEVVLISYVRGIYFFRIPLLGYAALVNLGGIPLKFILISIIVTSVGLKFALKRRKRKAT
ncbi:MAG: signal peptidase I [Candidatus Moranbacteria bacterium]|nr:signal peptidase I [Candidatus Moranbacteria bacterium]